MTGAELIQSPSGTEDRYSDVSAMLQSLTPTEPVYCIHPEKYRQGVAEFLAGFSGRVLYAVKANDHPAILRCLSEAGVTHFDCASVPEIAAVRSNCANSTCYFMVPARLRGAASEAQHRYGVRHFMVDHSDGLDILDREIDFKGTVVFARMAVHHASAMQDLSSKFGAPVGEIPALLSAIKARGAEPALAFNVGSGVMSPDAYQHAIGIAAEVLNTLPFKVRLIDIGGGYPKSYPDFEAPPLTEYFATIADTATSLPMAENGELMCEPGRALAAPGLSAVVEVLLRKGDRLYINDGIYGIFWELRFKGHERFPAEAFRDGRPHTGVTRQFRLFGPTCDQTDVLPGLVPLPADIRAGDYIEFSRIGAYSLSGRTRFNGHYSDAVVTIEPSGSRRDWRDAHANT